MSKFHLSNGLYFEKCKGGAVRIIQTKDGAEIATDKSNIEYEIYINCDAWCSVVHSVSHNSKLNYQDVEIMHGMLEIPPES